MLARLAALDGDGDDLGQVGGVGLDRHGDVVEHVLGAGGDLALDLAARPDAERTADAARAMVRDRFSIEGMATALTSVYDDAVAHTADRSPTP